MISHPTTVTALRANWFGLAGERVAPAVRPDQRQRDRQRHPRRPTPTTTACPYSLTEEFTSVYRMHPLLRDDWTLRRVADDALGARVTFADLTGPQAYDVIERARADRPALLLRHPAPGPGDAAQLPEVPPGVHPARRPGHGPRRGRHPADPRARGARATTSSAGSCTSSRSETFEELAAEPEWAREISDVYGGDIEKVDLSVGLFAERRPQGFAFSDTAFRVFVLMASRRLNSDRFFTDYYTPAVYTQAGLDWIADNSMASVLLRHHPELRPALSGVDNAFAAWRRTAD